MFLYACFIGLLELQKENGYIRMATASLWIGKFGSELKTKEADARKAFA
jgi:hypothetical protein